MLQWLKRKQGDQTQAKFKHFLVKASSKKRLVLFHTRSFNANYAEVQLILCKDNHYVLQTRNYVTENKCSRYFCFFNCKETGGINKLGLMKRKGLYNGIILIEVTLYYY